MMAVTVLGAEEDPATSALTPARFATHRAPSRKKRTGKSNQKTSSKEDPKRRSKNFRLAVFRHYHFAADNSSPDDSDRIVRIDFSHLNSPQWLGNRAHL